MLIMASEGPSTSSSLIERVRNLQDQEAWREFEIIYKPLIRRYVRSRGVGEPELDYLVQDVFEKLVEELPKFDYERSRGRFRAWLYRVTISVLAEAARSRRRAAAAEAGWRARFLSELADRGESLEAEWRREFRRQVAAEATVRVRADCQPKAWRCFEQRLIRGRPAKQVARELDLKPDTVYVYASQVLARVREACRELGEEFEDE